MATQQNDQGDRLGSKRTLEEPKQKQARSKRSRYVNKACESCKRRKLKCDGEEPCERCLLQDVECIYATAVSLPPPDWSDIQLISTDIENLRGNLEQVMKTLTPIHEGSRSRRPDSASFSNQPAAVQRPANEVGCDAVHEESRPTPLTEPSPCRGPTSSEFAFEVARERLETLGLDSVEAGPLSRRDELEFASFSPVRMLDLGNAEKWLEKDPLCQMSKQEVCRLIDVWGNGIGKLFPIVDIEKLHARWESLHTMLARARTRGDRQGCLTIVQALSEGDTCILKLVLANSLAAGSGGMDETARRLFDSTGGAPQAAMTDTPTLRNINMLLLVCILYYHLDDEMRANRVISLSVRLCFEMGLHRTETFQNSIKVGDDQDAAVATFWSVYVLERRSSIGLGVPFIMQDMEIDPSLPRPSKHLYLEAMVGLTKLSGQVSRRTSKLRDRTVKFPVDEIDYQDYMVLQWQKHLTPELKPDFNELHRGRNPPLDLSTVPATFLAIVLHVRTQQLRGLIYRPVLYSASRIAENKEHAQMAVDIAREAVQFLATASRTTTLAIDEPLFFRDFLISHLAAILLAVSNAPADFSHQLNDEFYLVMDVFQNLSSRSPVIARVWKCIRVLEVVGPKLGLIRKAQSLQAPNVEDGGGDYASLLHSQQHDIAPRAGHEPLVQMTSTWTPLPHGLDQTIFDPKDIPFSTAMFPTQLRNELSMMDESLDDMATNLLLDYSFADDFHARTSWQP